MRKSTTDVDVIRVFNFRKAYTSWFGKPFLAVERISFGLDYGECFALLGVNGAGKSTLLKILSRVTNPTTGEIKTKGRIASLLEVGTGFHPELTGRENIYLNGSELKI